MADDRIGKYAILKELTHGGMSTIYLALHEELNRQVALKVMRPDLSQDADFVRRFEQEARIIAKLEHTHILQVYDFGKYNDSYYIAMEYVDGPDLEMLLKQNGPIPWEIAGALLYHISLALVEAHSRHIVHRDLKLQNILIKNNGTAKLADFGISKDFELKNITRTRDLIGTPYYMAPEIIKGRPSSALTDIYGVGVCLYYAITGRPPFDGPSIASVFDRIAKGDFAPISENGVFAVPEITEIIRKCMAVAPDERYADAAHLSSALFACLSRYHVAADRQEVERYLKEPHRYIVERRGKGIAAKQEEADALLKEGKVFEAFQAYKDLLALDPENKKVEERILQLGKALPKKESTQVVGGYIPEDALSPLWRKIGVTIAFLILLSAGIVFYFIDKDKLRQPRPSPVLTALSNRPMAPVEVLKTDSIVEDTLKKMYTKTAPLKKPTPMPADTQTAVTAPDTVKATPCFGLLSVFSGVWADIFLDDKKWGRSPTKEAIKIPCGEYQLRLENNNGNAYSRRITIDNAAPAHLKVERDEFK